MRGLIQKLTQLFFLNWIWGRQVLLCFLLSVTFKGTSFSNFPLKSVISGLSLLSKNLENAISQNGKSEKYFYAPFLIHMVVEFKKSKLPTLLHFVQVKVPYQPHVTK